MPAIRPPRTFADLAGTLAPGQLPAGYGQTYVFAQSTPASVWTITHGLGKYPSVTVVDSAGDRCWGSTVYVSDNQITVTFSAPFAGNAYLN